MRRLLACLTLASTLVTGAAVLAPIASAQASPLSTSADDDYPRHYVFAGHYPSEAACVEQAVEYITTQPWNYYDYLCTGSDTAWTLHLAYYA